MGGKDKNILRRKIYMHYASWVDAKISFKRRQKYIYAVLVQMKRNTLQVDEDYWK